MLAFCDQDDVWSPAKVGTALEVLGSTGADLFVHTAAVIDDEGRPVDSFDQGTTEDAVHPPLHLGPWSVFYGFSMVFPRRLLELVDPAQRGAHTFEHSGLLSHYLWIYFLATSVGRVATDTRPLVRYRRHGGNVTPSMRARWTTALGVAAHPDLRRDEIAAHRAAVMEELYASAGDPVVRSRAADAARYWRRISAFESARMEMYGADAFLRRSERCARLALSGAYRSFSRGGLGTRLLVKDALVGVARARRPSLARTSLPARI